MRLILGILLAWGTTAATAAARPGMIVRELEVDAAKADGKARITIGQTMITLDDCIVRASRNGVKQAQRAAVGSPCSFGKTATGKVRILQIGARFVLTVESSVPVAGSRDCRTRIQGIVVDRRSVGLARRPQAIAACGPARWDQMMLESFAVRPVPMPLE